MEGDSRRCVWVGNLPDKIDEELLYELFLQAGPIEAVSLPKQPNGRPRSYGFVTFKHESSTSYAQSLFCTTTLHGQELLVKPQSRNRDGYDRSEEHIEHMPSLPSLSALRGLSRVSGRDNLSRDWKDLKAQSNFVPDLSKIDWSQQTNAEAPNFNLLLQLGQQLQQAMPSSNSAVGNHMYPSQQFDPMMPREPREPGKHHQRHNNRPNPYWDDRHNRQSSSADRRYQSGSRHNQPSSSNRQRHRERKGGRY